MMLRSFTALFFVVSLLSMGTCSAQLIVAHRGASHDAPENTLASFELAFERGADAIEGDFYLTADGEIACIHDKTTKRVAPDQPELVVADSTLDQLRQLDVGRWKDASYVGQRIPALAEVLATVPPGKRIFVEIKSGPEIVPALKTQLASCDLQTDQIVIIAFSEAVVKACRQSMPQYQCNWLTSFKRTDAPASWKPEQKDVIASLTRTEATGLGAHGNEEVIEREFVERVHAAGYEFHVWTINDLDAARRFVRLGVDSITTDRPALIRKSLASSDLSTVEKRSLRRVACQGTYPHHLQGMDVDDEFIYWSFTTTLVKTDHDGVIQKKVPVANHHGDLCFRDGKLYVAVNLGRFNDPMGNADSWVYVYDAKSLNEIARHEVQEVVFGAGGIGFRDDHFYVVGGLPDGVDENYVYEYDSDFRYLGTHVIQSGHTHLGIQTAVFAHGRWWFGCYGSSQPLLVTDSEFRFQGRYDFNCSLGIAAGSQGRLIVADGSCAKDEGCKGSVQMAHPHSQRGLVLAERN
ncbi:glycerophosphodiester phosphodiesterase [Rhodopirellula sp. SWK7]|uniref:glycerophosphodiester phosphodiesterase n=1 Tax=Rhodopirellula sp. SWK7 TaxID=595460 RepID=UPI0002BF7A30|nr:glycerophosphodiester phosphodiesterase [Rhodopirellula sp. SWK7]EMI42625.1 glycerophosphoryl diester phosphodiesterase [Rhodopirellula sp. SWK7]